MGTRADFYVGRNPETMEWLGSIAWDGYPSYFKGVGVLEAKNETEFRDKVENNLKERDDATLPHQGWPWPWENSRTTDYAYAFEDNKVWVCSFGRGWVPAEDTLDETKCVFDAYEKQEFPNMERTEPIPLASPRSGLITVMRRE